MLETREVLLQCSICRNRRNIILSVDQKRRLAQNKRLELQCGVCVARTYWEPVGELPITGPASGPRKLRSILIVDDDEATVGLLKKVLAIWDAKIEGAQSGKEALLKLSAESFDLLICDVHLPEMSGEEIFRHIQERDLIPAERIIFLTGDHSAGLKQFLDSTGCRVLYKPIQFLTLSSEIQDLLSGERS